MVAVEAVRHDRPAHHPGGAGFGDQVGGDLQEVQPGQRVMKRGQLGGVLGTDLLSRNLIRPHSADQERIRFLENG